MAKRKESLSDEEFAKRYKELMKTKDQKPVSKQSFDKAIKKTLTTKKQGGLSSK